MIVGAMMMVKQCHVLINPVIGFKKDQLVSPRVIARPFFIAPLHVICRLGKI